MRPYTNFHRRTRKPIFYGWWICIAAAVSQACITGTFYQGFGAFFDPIVDRFGWSRAVTSGAISIQQAGLGTISPFMGFVYNKFGPRKVMLGGVFIIGLGLICLSRINTLWQFYAAFTLITLGLPFGTFLIVSTTVANWFVIRRSRALSIVAVGSGLGGLLIPVVIWLISVTDWRTALLTIGIVIWVVEIPVALVMRRRPEDFGLQPDGGPNGSDTHSQTHGRVETGTRLTPSPASKIIVESPEEVDFSIREAIKTKTFWQMASAFGASHFIMSAQVHQIPAITSFGISRETAGIVIMGLSIIGLIGRIGGGVLGDLVDKRWVLAIAFASQSIGILIFANTHASWHLLGFVVFWGIGFGASVPVSLALLADLFGRRNFGSIMGAMMAVSTLLGVTGPILVGWMVDITESYRYPFMLFSIVILVAVPLIMTLNYPKLKMASDS